MVRVSRGGEENFARRGVLVGKIAEEAGPPTRPVDDNAVSWRSCLTPRPSADIQRRVTVREKKTTGAMPHALQHCVKIVRPPFRNAPLWAWKDAGKISTPLMSFDPKAIQSCPRPNDRPRKLQLVMPVTASPNVTAGCTSHFGTSTSSYWSPHAAARIRGCCLFIHAVLTFVVVRALGEHTEGPALPLPPECAAFLEHTCGPSGGTPFRKGARCLSTTRKSPSTLCVGA